MLAHAAAGGADGDWLIADRQTAGRGRMGRVWESPPGGNLYASGLVRVRAGDPAAATLALVAGVAVHEALSVWAEGLVLKWPNDVLASRRHAELVSASTAATGDIPLVAPWTLKRVQGDGDAGRQGVAANAKLAGVLLERAGDAVVIGVGVNVGHAPEVSGRAVTSLSELGVAAPDGEAIVGVLAETLTRWLQVWRTAGLPAIRNAWTARAHPIGIALSTTLPDGSRIEGLFDGLSETLALQLRLADGSVRVIHAGDVFLI